MIIDGRETAKKIRIALKKEVSHLDGNPKLAVVLVGDDPASHYYVRSKEKFAKRAGVDSQVIRMDAETKQNELLQVVNDLNNDVTVHGILVQFPLPRHLDEEEVKLTIKPEKDVDGLHILNVGRLVTGLDGLTPCTPTGVIELIEETGVPIEGKHAVVVGRSMLVGKPIAMMLLAKNATVTMCHSRTKDLQKHLLDADIIVAAVGIPHFVKGDMIKPGAIVMDVGINRVDDGLVGDVDFDSAKDHAGYITPVPGGVGPMTISMLLKNTVKAFRSQTNQ